MRLLLDTHAWIWLVQGKSRIAPVVRQLERSSSRGELFLCSASIYEATLLGINERVRMLPTPHAWIDEAVAASRVAVVPIDHAIARDAATATALHGDPFDRFIVHAAIQTSAKLVTVDQKLLGFAKARGLSTLEP